ncbi:MAG: hypothetical protein OEV66_03990 [Spirochaetia bacterium]|nr:hypothetical protein [Spirochaetia bacterium]
MISGFFKNLLQIFAFACLLTAGYLNIIVIPENHTGLLVDATRGLQQPFLKPGYHWNWTGFIPFKWSLYSIDMNPPVVDFHFIQPLHYGRYMEEPKDFSIDLKLNIKYGLSEQSLLFFWNYLHKNISDYPKYLNDHIKLIIEFFILENYKTENDVAGLNPLLRQYFLPGGKFEMDWKTAFNEEDITLDHFDLARLQTPEATIYFDKLKNIGQVFQTLREASAERILADADAYKKRLNNQIELEKTEQFIEIMKKYPDIIKYYQIEKINPQASSVILLNDRVNENEIVKNSIKPSPAPMEKTGKKEPPQEAPGHIHPEESGKIEAIKK